MLLTPAVAVGMKCAGRPSNIEHVHEHVCVYDHGINSLILEAFLILSAMRVVGDLEE